MDGGIWGFKMGSSLGVSYIQGGAYLLLLQFYETFFASAAGRSSRRFPLSGCLLVANIFSQNTRHGVRGDMLRKNGTDRSLPCSPDEVLTQLMGQQQRQR